MNKYNQVQTQQNRNQLLDDLPSEFIVKKLKEIFRNHIGQENGITMPEIYEYVYEGKMTNNKYQYLIQCQRILSLMNGLKKRTRYFIVGGYNEEKVYVWYVLKTREEANQYQNSVDYKIKGFQIMKEKSEIAFREEFWRNLDEKLPKKKDQKFDVEV